MSKRREEGLQADLRYEIKEEPQKRFEGRLKRIENSWINKTFTSSFITLDEGDKGEWGYTFFGKVPESFLGKDVALIHMREGNTFEQLLVSKEKDYNYNIRAVLTDFY